MRLGLAWSCALATACGFSSPKPGAGTDAPILGDGCTSRSAQIDTCPLPGGYALMLSGTLLFDTETGVLKDTLTNIETPVVSMPVATRGGEVRALVATSVTLMPDTTLRAVGVRGFGIVASQGITLQGNAVIDVSKGGAGHRGTCGTDAAVDGAPDTSGGAGGGGGGLGAAGGNGGDGDSDNGQSTGGAGGKAAAAAPAGPLGGCAGGKGGKGDSVQNDGGAGGLGGGTAYLFSAVSIVIASGAGIDAGGDGGGGGKRVTDLTNGDAGGGGGGSGGSIFLEAPAIRSAGTLAANGGGGGEGSGGTSLGRPGAPGTFGIMVAAGGQGGATNGADGADGGYVTTAAGQTPSQLRSGGGGGGGGSVGFIRVESADAQLGTNVSPAPTPL